jgi:2-polyprenyl-3-methyl-5-hydroxy-6-metoxy-1,4-benzoquinol methylase
MGTITEPLDAAVRAALKSRWRIPILRHLLRLDSTVKRWVSTFAMEGDLHPKHRLIKYHDFFISNVSPGDRVLDIGCGNGLVAYKVADHAAHVTGIDFDTAGIAQAKRTYQRSNIDFLVGDATTYEFNDDFDVIIMSNVLEHIDDRVALLKKIARLAPKVLLRVPMIDRDWLPLLKQEMGIDYRLDSTHTIEYTEEIFRQELQQAGYTIQHLHVRFGEIYCVATT